MPTQYLHENVMSVPTHKKDTVLNLRVSKEFGEKISALAEKDGRTITNWIERVVEAEYEKAFKEKRRG